MPSLAGESSISPPILVSVGIQRRGAHRRLLLPRPGHRVLGQYTALGDVATRHMHMQCIACCCHHTTCNSIIRFYGNRVLLPMPDHRVLGQCTALGDESLRHMMHPVLVPCTAFYYHHTTCNSIIRFNSNRLLLPRPGHRVLGQCTTLGDDSSRHMMHPVLVPCTAFSFLLLPSYDVKFHHTIEWLSYDCSGPWDVRTH